MSSRKNLVALAFLLCLTTLLGAVSAGPNSILPATTGLNSHVTATGGSAPSPSQLLATISPLTGGLASQSTVQLDGQSTCTLITPANGCGKTTLSTATVSTAATFRAGVVITGAGNPTAATVLIFNANFKFCFFVGAPQACSAATLWGAGAVVIYDANNNNVYDTGDIVVAGAAPPTATAGFKPDGRIKFIDTTPANGLYDFGETVVADTTGTAGANGSWASLAADPYIGPAVFGWQFGLNYDPTLFLTQMDPCSVGSSVCGPAAGASTYPDGQGTDVVLGHQAAATICPVYQRVSTNTGCNWDSAGTQGSIALSQTPGKIIVGFTYLAPRNGTFINGLDLLGNVAFELIKAGTVSISISAADTKFVDINANVVPYPIGVQSSVSVTVSNAPPVATFTATQVNPPDPTLCPTLVAGACWRFDASASTASGTATLTNPTSYFWDFGDGLNDFGVTGPIVTHDFGITGTFDVSLRVVDSNTATGSARDNNGAVIVNAQPSHTDHVVNAVPPAHATTTAVSCNPSTVAFGASTTCTATVTDTSATPTTPTGTVTFTSSGTGTFTGSPCTLTGTGASATCSASYSPTGTGTRTDTITGSYNGDTGHSTSSGTFSLSVGVATHPTTTTVACTPSTVTINQATSCTATVTDTSTTGATTPTGTVTFTPGGTCTLAGTGASSTCSVSITPTVSGTLSVSASYGGDTNHGTSTGSASVTVNKRTTTTTVACTPSTVVINQATSCTATVTDTATGTTSTPTGTVTFTPGGTCTLAGTGASATCSVSVTPTAAGSLSVSASYGGDANHATSTGSATVTVTVRATTTSVACTPSTVMVGQATSCTATVTDTSTGTAITPSGTVTFTPGGTCTLAGTGTTATCSVSITPTATGTLSVSASYGGDTNHGTSTGSASVTVNKRTTTTTVACTPSTVVIGQATSCTATVTDTAAGTTSTPTGTVTFTPGGTCTLAGTGATATCSVTYTPTAVGTGSHLITGTYSGDTNHATSSGTATIAIGLHPTTTTVACAPSTITLGASTSCTATVTDTSTTGATTPTGTVTFTPAGTCTLAGTTASAT